MKTHRKILQDTVVRHGAAAVRLQLGDEINENWHVHTGIVVRLYAVQLHTTKTPSINASFQLKRSVLRSGYSQ